MQSMDRCYWCLLPEELAFRKIADTEEEFTALWKDKDFLTDWHMESMVEIAEKSLGPLGNGRCYCFKIPTVLGGDYTAENLGTVALEELVSFSGDVAKQIKDLPDDATVRFRVVD